MVGTVLDDRYKVIELLGRGGVGEVYLVEHIHLQRREALKVLKPRIAEDPELESRFRREARVAHRVAHPNIVGVHDFGRLPDGRMYLAMEYAGGESLEALLQRVSQLPTPPALELLAQLANAIDYAHSRGVIHRDLKPENLLITEHRGRVNFLKVLDFGIAKIVDPDYQDSVGTTNNRVHGTPYYMAPEQAKEELLDSRLDIYAAGCIGVKMLTGRPPFTGSMASVLTAHLYEEPPDLRSLPGGSELPEELCSIITRCLQKDPRLRFQSGAELAEALRKVPGYPDDSQGRRRRLSRASLVGRSSPGSYFDDKTEKHVEEPPPEELDRREEQLEAHIGHLRLLAEVQVDAGCPDPFVLLALTELREAEAEIERLDRELDALAERANEFERWAREREALLRFTLAELRYQGAHGAPGVQARAAEMEKRLARLITDHGRDLAAITEREIAAVAKRAARQELRVKAMNRLSAALYETD